MDKSSIPSRYKHLASKWKDGSITPEEAEEFATWYNKDQDREVLIPEHFAKNIEELENSIYQKIDHQINHAKKVPLWPRWAAAAAVVIAVIMGAYFYYTKQIVNLNSSIVYQHDIAPGKNGATLTLANGKKIRLTDAVNGQLAEEAGVTITKTKDGQITYVISNEGNEERSLQYGRDDGNRTNMLSTAKGETYQVRLPDGTLVFLNAESSISYPASFAGGKERHVTLTGEAYFEVAHLSPSGGGRGRIPFIVKTPTQEVEVLGTHFNVNTYQNESTVKTTLLEGSVRVVPTTQPSNKPITQQTTLKPGQQAINNNATINVKEVDVNEAVSWKDGYFDFTDADIQAVMRQFARWYNVEVVFDGPITKETFTGRVPRKWTLSQVLKIVKSSNSVKINVEGRRIMVRE